jgi:hypothetical protein
MKSKAIGILVCMMMLATIPIAAGLNCEIGSKCGTTGIFNKTIIRGIVLYPRISQDGKTINFLALRLSFRTIYLDGITHGLVKFQRIQIPNNFKGYFGNFYIFGTFRGSLDI